MPTTPPQLRRVSPFSPDVLDLIDQLDKFSLLHYKPEESPLDPPEVLARENCIMIAAYDGTRICGIGAVKFFEDYGEIKRMFVAPAFRGRGISKLIMDELLSLTKQKNLKYARLETGARFKEAVALYEKSGFEVREPFGEYEKTEVNVYMEKALFQKSADNQ